MAIGDDWTIDYVNRRIYYVGTGTRYTVREFYSWLMDTFDELAQMDDPVPMSASTPTDYTLLNAWFIPYTSFHYLKGGSIATSGWNADSYDGGILKIVFEESGYTDAVSSDIGKTVTGSTTGDFGTLLDYDNTNRIWWVRVTTAGTYASAGETVSVSGGTGSGTVASTATGENLWSNLYTLGTIEEDTNMYIYYGQYPLTPTDEITPIWWTIGHIDILVLIKEADTLKGGGYVTVFARNYGDYYDFFEIDISGGGRNPVPISTSTDIDNQTKASTVRDYNDVQILQVDGKLNVTGETGSFQTWEKVTGGTSGATAYVIEYSSDYHYLILGQVEGTFQDGETITGDTSGVSATVSGTLDVSVTTANKDLNNGAGPRPYDIHINCASRPLSEVYEYMKYVTAKPYYWIDYAKFYNADTGTYTDETEDINNATTDDVYLPPQQATTEGDALYIGSDDQFDMFRIYVSTKGEYSDITIVWEYWNGSSWATLTVTDPSNGFQNDGIHKITFTPPGDWATTEVDGTTAYWIRARATFGASPSITTAPLGAEGWIDFGDSWYIIQNDGSTNYKTYGEVYKYAQSTYTPVKQAPFGQYLGGTLFGARGVWIENMDPGDAKNFQLRDSNDVIQVPPNIVVVKVTSVESGDRVAVFRLTAAGGDIDKQRYQLAYIHNDSVQFHNADTDTWTDETSDASESTADDVYLPPQQATTEGDAIYFGADYKFNTVRINVTTAGSYSDITINWEYWNGSSWTALSGVTDNTNGFTTAGTNDVTFTVPTDWEKTEVNGVRGYYIRARATFGASPSITTAPLAGETWIWHNYNGGEVVAVGSTISGDEPLSGIVRVVRADNTDARFKYTDFSGQRFILDSSTPINEDFSEGQYVYVPIIDEEATGTEVSNTLVYSTDIPVIVRVRKYGIRPFEVESTVTDVGLSVSAIRTTDNIVL